ncbi:ComF family protein [Myxococcota bacterium]|nr:ComF family protein [Myxococcota bacterium]
MCRACSAALPWLEPQALAPAPLRLDACAAAVSYRGHVETWVQRFKFRAPGLAGFDPAASAVMGWLIECASLPLTRERPDLIVPVPLHPRKLRARGFNPAAELARVLARRQGVPLDTRTLERIRNTPSQTALGRSARGHNVRGAFRARPLHHTAKHIWLVDDVVTTGSTLSEAAAALRGAGAGVVSGICVAHTPGPWDRSREPVPSG